MSAGRASLVLGTLAVGAMEAQHRTARRTILIAFQATWDAYGPAVTGGSTVRLTGSGEFDDRTRQAMIEVLAVHGLDRRVLQGMAVSGSVLHSWYTSELKPRLESVAPQLLEGGQLWATHDPVRRGEAGEVARQIDAFIDQGQPIQFERARIVSPETQTVDRGLLITARGGRRSPLPTWAWWAIGGGALAVAGWLTYKALGKPKPRRA